MTESTPTPVHAGEADRWGGWHWREPARGEHFRRCSYCGSIHPDDFVTIARGRIDWADRKYGWPHKFYVHVPNPEPDRLFYMGSAPIGASDVTSGKIAGWIGEDELTSEQRDILVRDGVTPERTRAYKFGPRAEHFGKVYTVHLADPAISDDTKAAAAAMCGLRFEFLDDGRIRWAPAS